MNMPLSFSKQSVLPRYWQLKELIRERIRRQEWLPGTALPSERVFVQQYGISRMTVRQALSELVNEGVVYREQGKGTFVKPFLTQAVPMRLLGFTERIEAQGKHVSTKVLAAQMEPADETIATALRIKPGQLVFHLHRLRFIDGKPCVLERTHVSFRGCELLLEEDLEQGSLYQLLESRYGVLLVKAEQDISIVALGREESLTFNLPLRSPAHLIHRLAFPEQEQPVEYLVAYSAYRYE